jgi:excisionase family DNA binding protein
LETNSIREAAERLAVSAKVVRRLVAQGTLRAIKMPGAHGDEWRVDAASLAAYKASPSPPRPASPSVPAHTEAPAPALHRELDSLREDKAFLQKQVDSLGALLSRALDAPRPAPPHAASTETDAEQPPSSPAPSVTAALQSSLRLVSAPEVAAVELCSVKLLWGRPVLWRLIAREPADVATLMDAILAPTAAWDAPGEEVVFLWLRDAVGEVLWGCACGPHWFGAAFEDALRVVHVERA